MHRYLVTGGVGFIGSNFIKYLFEDNKDISIINIDKLTYAGDLKNLKCIENNDNYMKIPFNKAYMTGNELKSIQEVFNRGMTSGDNYFTCQVATLLDSVNKLHI